MSYQEFIKLVDQTSKNFDWRYGQSLMNVLYGIWPEKYNEITASELDPYYIDNNVTKVLETLKANWKPTKK